MNLNRSNAIGFVQAHFCPVFTTVIGFVNTISVGNTISGPGFTAAYPISFVRIIWVEGIGFFCWG
jgi:hypothetical protein